MLLTQEFEPFIRDICKRFEVPELIAKIVENAEPALRMYTLPVPNYSTTHETSHFGGRPSLPEEIEWPQDDEGNYLDFILQIRLSEAAYMVQARSLPDRGMLFLFADHRIQNDMETEGGKHKVIYSTSEDAPAREQPFEYEAMSVDDAPHDMAIRERLLRFSEVVTIYDANRLQERLEVELSEGEAEVYEENFDCATCDTSLHLLFGLETHGETYPDIDDPENWSMLFRVDHDSDLNTMWFDGGRLHVFIRNNDLIEGDFSKTVAAYSSC